MQSGERQTDQVAMSPLAQVVPNFLDSTCHD